MLGFGDQPGHTTLPWASIGCLLSQVGRLLLSRLWLPETDWDCCTSLHPTLDVLVTAGRDASARVWDMRTKSQVHILSGHTGTISSVQCQESDPQVITGSMDSTIK